MIDKLRGVTRELAVLLVAATCAGCPAMAITQGAEIAASSTFDDRSYEQQASDEESKAEIEKAFVDQDPALAAKVNVDVYRGRVMLTGVVARESDRRTAFSLADGAAGGGVIYDDIQVSEGGGLEDEAADFVANKELGAELLEAEGLSSQSYQHRVVNGFAYVMGQATMVSQVETVRQTALGISDVHQVVTHITVEE